MGYFYEIATTASAFRKPSHYDTHPPARSKGPATIGLGPDRQQRCMF